MRTRRTRNGRRPRGSSPRRTRPARARGRATVRHQSARRRERPVSRRRPTGHHGRYSYRTRTPGLSLSKPLMAGIAVAAAALAIAGYLVARHVHVGGSAVAAADPIAAQFVYTAATANDARITLPAAVQSELQNIGLHDEFIALTRVGYDGNVSTSVIDMTPRTGNSPSDPVLKVHSRAVAAVDAKISAIQNTINTPVAAHGGSQALYAGLIKADFTSAPVTIISTGLDVANPDNFRTLAWSGAAATELAADVKNADEQPALHGPVTFVTVPTTSPQPELGQAQQSYRDTLWRNLLTAAGATSVTFIDASGSLPSPGAPSAPIVPVPPMVSTPHGYTATCTLPSSYFIFGTATLVNPTATEQDLAGCISNALAAHATFALDGWASYQGPLKPNGQPEFNYGYNRKLSKARVQAIANLLVSRLSVPRSAISRLTWHGNLDLPDSSDPGSSANQVVTITYTTK
jgi:hypothetical protein